MKAISLKQPWAGLIAAELKSIETRTWSTNYRGELLICSSKRDDEHLPPPYPNKNCYVRGATICLVKVVDCVPFEEKHVQKACCELYDGYAWILEDIRIVRHIPIKGQLNIYDLPGLTMDDLTVDCLSCFYFSSFREQYCDPIEPNDIGFCTCPTSPLHGDKGAGMDKQCSDIEIR